MSWMADEKKKPKNKKRFFSSEVHIQANKFINKCGWWCRLGWVGGGVGVEYLSYPNCDSYSCIPMQALQLINVSCKDKGLHIF